MGVTADIGTCSGVPEGSGIGVDPTEGAPTEDGAQETEAAGAGTTDDSGATGAGAMEAGPT